MYDFPIDLGYAHENGRYIEVGGPSDIESSLVISIQVWGVKEDKNELNLSANQW